VHVLRLDLDGAGGAAQEALRAALTPQERARADRFAFPHLRARFTAGRGALRRLLGGLLACPPAEVALVEGPHGKPLLAPRLAGSGLHFNLSHTGALALLAVARGRALGVDVEAWREDVEPLELGAAVFSPAELRVLAALPPAEHRRHFFRLWALKEAVIKAEGTGFSRPSTDFTVALAEGGAPPRLVQGGPGAPGAPAAGAWELVELAAGPGVSAALALAPPLPAVCAWDAQGLLLGG
jgi:4'-phosphopantetheinyl transferase